MGNIDISALIGPGISAETADLAAFVAQNVVKVKPHIGRCRGVIPLPRKQLGFKPEKLSEAGRGFYTSHLSAGRLCIIPEKDEQAFERIEARLRCAIHKVEMTEGFVPIAAYESLKTQYEDISKDYFAARDDVYARWNDIVKDFKAGAEAMFKGVRMQQREREKMLKVIFSDIPSAEAFKNSFYMELQVTAFPAVASPDGLSSSVKADVERSWGDSVVATALNAIEAAIGEGWSMLCTAANAYSRGGVIPSKTLGGMDRYASDMGFKNVFRNPMLDAVAARMGNISKTPGSDAKEDLVEEAMLDLFDYCDSNGLDLDMSIAPFDAKSLKDMSDLRKAEAAAQLKV